MCVRHLMLASQQQHHPIRAHIQNGYRDARKAVILLLGYTLQSSATPSCDEEKHNRPHLDGVQNSIFLGSLREIYIYGEHSRREQQRDRENNPEGAHT